MFRTLALIAALSSGPLSAQKLAPHYMTAQEWLTKWESSDFSEQAQATGYAEGAADGLSAIFELAETRNDVICFPENSTSGQIAAAGAKHVKDNPVLWNYPAASALIVAWAETWPCSPD